MYGWNSDNVMICAIMKMASLFIPFFMVPVFLAILLQHNSKPLLTGISFYFTNLLITFQFPIIVSNVFIPCINCRCLNPFPFVLWRHILINFSHACSKLANNIVHIFRVRRRKLFLKKVILIRKMFDCVCHNQ